MFIKVNELICESLSGGWQYTTSEILINANRISSVKKDMLIDRECTGITLDNTFYYVTETIEQLMDRIKHESL